MSTFLLGCGQRQKSPHAPPKEPAATVALKLAVVDDPALSKMIESLAAEWQAQSGNTLSVEQLSERALLDGDALPRGVDAIVAADRLLGPLAERGWIAPLPTNFAQDKTLAWPDTFELLQLVSTRFGQSVYGVPLGSPVFVCYCRKDLLEQHERRPPATWKEYNELAELIARENVGKTPGLQYAAAEPLAPGWAWRSLLARAAAYAVHRDHFSTLFNIETMEPLIAGESFVKALEELVAAAKWRSSDPIAFDLDGVRREFMLGRCALAITWPGRDREESALADGTIVFAELPGSRTSFNFAAKQWTERAPDDRHVTLLGLSGRMGMIARSSSHQSDVFRLLSWLSGPQWGTKVSASSPQTTLYRRSQVRAPQPWLEEGIGAAAAQEYAFAVRDSLNRTSHLSVPRIPGQDRYAEALDEVVRIAISGRLSAAEALHEAAKRWQEITAELGLEAQKSAYRKSLGLD